jgi:transposase, IS30 family
MVLNNADYAKARKLRAAGLSMRDIGRQVGCSRQEVWRIVRPGSTKGGGPLPWMPGPGRLTLPEREEISRGLRKEETFTSIAGQLARSVSTVSREVKANGGRKDYRAWKGHKRAESCVKRPKSARLACPRLAGQVTTWLEELKVPRGDSPPLAH